MRLSARFATATLVGLFAVACGSSATSNPGDTPKQDPGVDPGTGTGGVPTDGAEVNKYGKPYPTNNLGYQARSGKRPGNIIRNYKFYGYVDGDKSKGPTVVSLADFYDPEMRSVKIIHFSAGAIWCPPCNEEAKALVPLVPSLKEKKVIPIQALIEGAVRGTASVMSDLDVWQAKHKINYTLFLDPGQQNLGQFFDAAAIPWNAIIDARSMELLTSGVGYNPNMTKEYDTWLKWVDENPAQPAQ
ncbi:MAG: redoxin domain-containing protein [Deltaproteobacteria bacterium]|nr:redoxin domain-containing protein [Deltaproteobacteria bacterium]